MAKSLQAAVAAIAKAAEKLKAEVEVSLTELEKVAEGVAP